MSLLQFHAYDYDSVAINILLLSGHDKQSQKAAGAVVSSLGSLVEMMAGFAMVSKM